MRDQEQAFPDEATIGEWSPADRTKMLRRLEHLVGDHAEVGCNSVLSPGSLIGKHSIVYPGSQWRGFLPPNRIAKFRQEFSLVERRQ